MSNMITISGVRGFIDENGVAQLNAEDISRGLGFTQNKNGVEYVRWERVNGYVAEFGFSPLVGKEYWPENLVYRLGFKAENGTGKQFQAMLADEILPAIRRTGVYAVKPMSQLEILAQATQALLEQDKEIKRLSATQTEQAEEIKDIREIVALSPNDWRKETASLINKMARNLGSNDHIRDIRAESYKLLNERFGVSLEQRLINKRRRMADEGVCKSKRDKLNHMDVIAEDKKLIEGYVAIIKEMAIKYGAKPA